MSARIVALRLDWSDPAAVFAGGLGALENSFWLDAGPDAASGFSWMGPGTPEHRLPRELLLATAMGTTSAADEELPGAFRGGWVGWAGYDAAAAAAEAPARLDERDGPPQSWLRVSWFVAFDHAARGMWLVGPEDRLETAGVAVHRWVRAGRGRVDGVPSPPALQAASGRHTPAAYRSLIQSCRAAIRAGDAYQLCATTRFTVAAPDPVDPVALYLALRRRLPSPHGGFIRSGGTALLSASPERFLEVRGGTVRTRPIKGTRPRGHDADTDEVLRRDLRDSVKERAENIMIVDLMRNDLQRICVPGTVSVEGLLEIESYSAVHQLVSTVSGRLRPGTTLGALLDAAFPAGSMTGAPKLSAMTILHALEDAPRGLYAGCFGWIGADGTADLAMTIRSIVLRPDAAYVGAGGGITWLSDPDEEVAEVGVKARGPLAVLGAELPPGW